MPHTTQAGSAFGGFLEGAVGGFERGTQLRRQRTLNQQVADEILNRRRREGVIDERAAAVEGRAEDRFNIELFDAGLARGDAPTGPAGVTPAGLPSGLVENVNRLRTGTGAALAGFDDAPLGFHRIGLSADEREAERVSGFDAAVGNFMLASPEEQEAMLRDPSIIRALDELGQLDEAFEVATGSAASPFGVNVEGITGTAGTAEGAIALRRQLTPISDDPTGIEDLPVTLKNAVTQIGPAFDSLDRYEDLTDQFLSRGRLERARGIVGIPNAERDRLIGQLKSTQNQVLLNVKELANLGVLNGPDLDIITSLIGDPLSLESVIRNPEFVTTRIVETRKFLQDRINAINATFGTELGGGAGELDEDARIEELLDQGFSDEEIDAILRAESLRN